VRRLGGEEVRRLGGEEVRRTVDSDFRFFDGITRFEVIILISNSDF